MMGFRVGGLRILFDLLSYLIMIFHIKVFSWKFKISSKIRCILSVGERLTIALSSKFSLFFGNFLYFLTKLGTR